MVLDKEQAKMSKSAMDFTAEVTKRWPDRLVGSQGCLDCGDFLEKRLAEFCDSVSHQKFTVRPGAFLGFIRVNIVLYLLALVALYVGRVYISLALCNVSLLITVLQFFYYKEFINIFYPKKQGKNVWGKIEPSGEVKQQIIISAHHDSAHIFNFLEHSPETYVRKVMTGNAIQFAMFFLTWLAMFLHIMGHFQGLWYGAIVGFLTLGIIGLIPLWFFHDKKGTPGAGDNMICTALAIEIGKYFAQQKNAGNPLEHTRIIIASWDAEECGLRGARAFTNQYKEEFQALKTYNFNLECMYDHDSMAFLTSDLNGFVKLSENMAEQCVAISRTLGFEIGTHTFPFLAGGTDAAEFAKIGVEATTLAAMNWEERGEGIAYHTTRDTIDAVDEEAVARSIAIGIKYVAEKEREIS